MPDTLTVGELAERSGVATSALRYYEERGLIASDVASLLPLALGCSDTGQSPASRLKTRENRGDGTV